MGLEATCRMRGPEGSGDGKLLLETDELLFRGPPRLRIPLGSIAKVAASGGVLTVTSTLGVARFDLGPAAAKWAERIANPPSRATKIGVKPGDLVSVVGVEDEGIAAELEAAGAEVVRGRFRAKSAVILFGVERISQLGRLAALKGKLTPAGGLWVVHRKGPAGVKDVEIFAAAKVVGLTANKTMRFSETHAAERLVIPKASRQEA